MCAMADNSLLLLNYLQKLETITCITSKSIVKERIKQNGKLSKSVILILDQTFNLWKRDQQKQTSNTTENQLFIKSLEIYKNICELDTVLAQEISKCGGQRILNELMKFVITDDTDNNNDGEIIKELFYRISSFSFISTHTLSLNGFDDDELSRRLPLVYKLPLFSDNNKHSVIDDSTIFINQVVQLRQSAQEDVGFVLWPSSIILSNYMLKHQSKYSKSENVILELGSGCGLSGLTCAKKYNSKQVYITDVNPHVLLNLQQNVNLNDLKSMATVSYLNFYDTQNVQQPVQHDEFPSTLMEEQVPLEEIDLIIAADVICKEDDALALSKFLYTYLKPSALAIIVSAKEEHRFGVSIFASVCQNIGLDVVVKTIVSCEEDETNIIQYASGYVDHMEFYLYHIRKINE